MCGSVMCKNCAVSALLMCFIWAAVAMQSDKYVSALLMFCAVVDSITSFLFNLC